MSVKQTDKDQTRKRNQAVIYCRVSSVDQVENFSLETQETQARRFCEQRGLTVGRVFREAGKSAKTTEKRPAFQSMLRYCAQHWRELDAVVVYNVSRFSRDTASGSQALQELTGMGIKVLSVTEPFDNTAFGKFFRNFHISMAQWENDQKSERAIQSMLDALARGKWTHSPPLGYLSSKGLGVRPDPERAPLVTAAFERFATGQHSKSQVRDWLHKQGLRTRQGRALSAQTFGSMLRNPLYAGWVEAKKWNVRHRGEHQPLVCQDVFDRVQGILDGRTTPTSYQLANPLFPLRRFVRCRECGVPLTGSATKGRSQHYEYYSCRTRGCAGNVSRSTLENQFQSLVAGLRPRSEYLALMRVLVDEVWRERNESAAKARQGVERQLARIEQKRADLLDAAVFRKVLSDEDYVTERQRLDSEARALEEIRAQETVEPLDLERLWPRAERLLQSADTLWRDGTAHERLQLQAVLFPEGLTYASGQFGTAGSCPFYETWEPSQAPDRGMASPTGFEPVF